jgi:long-chain acyl-CoA synthetase
MKGYYKHQDLTDEIIDKEGWLKTGDIGHIDEDGYLEIAGRLKSTFKNSAGKYIYPEEIENKLKKSGFIANAVVTGISKPFLVAVIIPDFDFILNYYKDEFQAEDKNGMINSRKVISDIEKEINEYNKYQVVESEQVKNFALVTDIWSIEGGELTPTMKVKRNTILEKYAELIENQYK